MADRQVKIIINGDDQFSPAAQKATSAMGSLTGAVSSFQLGLSALSLGLVASELISAGVAADKMRNSMEAATGSALRGANEMAFVREEANRLGLDLQTSVDGFVKLAAASKGTALEGEGVRQVFSAISEAGTTLGLSAEEMNGAMLAVGQMISKGTVQAEELRGQLGERIPGAFQIAARAMGTTTAGLDDMLKKGQVVAEDFLPKFAVEMQNSFGASEQATHSAQAEINRFKTAVFEVKTLLMDQGGNDALKALALIGIDIANGFRGAIREIADAKIRIEDLITRWQLLKEFSWFSKAGRSEITAGFAAADAMFEYQQQRLEDRFGRLAVTSAAAASSSGGGSGGGKSGKQPKVGLTEDQRIALTSGRDELKQFYQFVWQENEAALAGEDFGKISDNSMSRFKMPTFSILGEGGLAAAQAQAQADLEFKRELMALDYELNSAASERSAAMQLENEQKLAAAKKEVWTNSTSAFMNLTGALYTFSGKKSRELFELNKIAGIANATVSTYQAATQAYRDVPYPYNIAAAAMIVSAGLANVANIASTSFGGAATGGYGGGTPSSPVVTQPVTTTNQQTQGETVIVLKGMPVPQWVEAELVPAINEAGTRNVRIEYDT